VAEGSILLLGAGGMLHRAWKELLDDDKSVRYESLGRAQLDLTDGAGIEKAVGDHRLVINCAAYTNVDGAEKEEALANAVNGTAVEELARVCGLRGALLVHYSTDYVFSGNAARPYRPGDVIAPINAYGRSKALGERLIRQSGCEHLVVRTSWLYAPWGKNFVRTMVAFLQKNHPLRIVNDQVGRPTSAQGLARNTWRLLEKRGRGIFHLADGGECTWIEFTKEIARQVESDVRVESCTTAELGRAAPRPAYSVLDLEESQRLIGPMKPWREALAEVIDRLE
jgi:dTDP-4-dehydrorhamnose reductase